MKVYLATSGNYSDYRVCHAFKRCEDAEAYELGDDVLELEVHDGPVDVRYWHMLHWFAWQPADGINPVEANHLRDFDGRPDHCDHQWNSALIPEKLTLTVQGWDLERVRKVYSEQRAEYLARQEGIS